MRRLVAVLLLVLGVPSLALASHTDPKRQIDAADQRKAASIVLKRTDFVAGWSKAADVPGDDDGHFSCPGYNPTEADLVLTGDAERAFKRPEGFPVVFSGANVYKTKGNALASWSRGAKPAMAPCFAKFMKNEIEAGGAQVRIARAGTMTFPRLAPRTIALKIVLEVSVTNAGETSTLPFTVNIVGVGNGRGDATLMTMGFGAGVAMPEVRAFAKLLSARLAAAKL
jgi:hypothetical protein